jgi:uncharacterized protein YdbL (DUF1318 family)
MNEPRRRSHWAEAGGLLWLLLSTLVCAAPAPEAQDYQALLASLQGRQARLDAELNNPRHCLGERLDGLLEINDNCLPAARDLADAENRDRKALHERMARDLKFGADAVGQQRADRYVDRYHPGVLREVRISERETTWWDGRPPDPRKTPIARVLALDGARIYVRPDSGSAVARDQVQQYEAFGVIDSAKDSGGGNWFQVTEAYVPKVKPPSWAPQALGWIAEDESIPWRRALVMRFTNPLERERSLFFAKPETLVPLLGRDQAQRRVEVERLIAAADRGAGGEVIAVEPLVNPNQERAVMYPVLDFYGKDRNTDLRIDGQATRVLEVAARTREGVDGPSVGTAPTIDILFVMDTTESMGPYLKDVLAAVQEFAAGSTDDGLRFGFVGYRDSDPRFQYQAREWTLAMQSANDFARTLSGIRAQPVPVSGDDIPEAVFEGVDLAIQSQQWRPSALKVVFLIGDAPGKDQAHSTEELRRKADLRQVRIFAFHLKNTKVSKGLDRVAEQQYRDLSSVYQGAYGTSAQQTYFRSIDSESKAFRQAMIAALRESQQNLAEVRDCAASGRGSECVRKAEPGTLSELIFQHAALALADTSMPRKDVRGWVADKALTNPGREALAPMVLFTEAELDELEARVRELKEVGELALRGERGTTVDFFDLVARNTRMTMVDPTAVNFRDAFAVPLGIDQLPYDSDIMSLTRDEFQNPDRVQDFLASMAAKLAVYEDLRRSRGDPQRWKQLSSGAKERVVGVELNHLP